MSKAQPALPTTQLGVLTINDICELRKFPVPQPGPHEVLIENVAVASILKDWKYPLSVVNCASIEGGGVSGHIVGIGRDVTDFKPGDRVAAFTKFDTGDPKYRAYAQFSVAPASTTFRVPDETSLEEAAAIPLATMTAALGLFVRLGFQKPQNAHESLDRSFAPLAPERSLMHNFFPAEQAILVYGADSPVGAYAVQLSKRAGLYVMAITGQSCDFVNSLGADVVLDHRKYGTAEKFEQAVTQALDSRICAYAFDTICRSGSTLILAHVVAKNAPEGEGRVTYARDLSDEEKQSMPIEVKARLINVGTAHAEDEEFARGFFKEIPSYLTLSPSNPSPLKPNRVKLMLGGLADIEEGLALLNSGQGHIETIVYRIADTAGLSKDA